VPTIALHTVLKAGREADYDRLHARVPDELVAAMREHGVRDWQIWRDGRDVFHLVEVDDYQAMRRGLRDHPVNADWQARVSPLFDRPDSYAGDDTGLDRIWALRAQR
jgi:L-rhamnose mutarotase